MTEAGYAAVQIIPSTKGFASALGSQLGGPMSSVGKEQGGKLGKAMKVGLVAGVAGAAATVTGLFKVGQEFDKAFDTIRVGTGATGKSLKALQGDFRAVARSVPASFGDASKAVADINTRLGLTDKPLQDVSKRMLELSRLTGTDLDTNIANITRLFGDWSVKTNQQAGTLDKLYRASQATGIGVDDLSQLMVQFGSPLRQLGLGFDFSAAMFARFEKEGVNIQTLMPGLRMGIKNFAQPTDDLAKTFKKLGIDASKPEKALIQTFNAIKKATPTKATNLAFDVFGSRAGPDMAAAIQEGRFELDDMIKTIRGGSDSILKGAADTRSFTETWQILKNRGLLLLEPVATRVFGALSKFAQWLLKDGIPAAKEFAGELREKLGPAFETAADLAGGALTVMKDVGKWMLDHKGVVKTLAGVIGGLIVVTKLHTAAMAVQAAGGIVAMLTSYLKNLKVVQVATKVAAAMQWLWNAALTANPIGLVIAAVAALVAGVIIAYKKSETFRKIVKGAFDAVAKAGKWLWEKALKPAFSAIVDAFKAVGRTFKKMWDNVLRPAFKAVVNAFLWVAEKIVSGAAKAFGWMPGLGPELRTAAEKFRTFKNQVNDALGGIKDKDVTVTGDLVAAGSGSTAVNRLLSSVPNRARGGILPGAPSSKDNMLVHAASGEFYVNAQSTKKHRALLEAINADRLPGFANGGLVPRADVPGRRQIGGFARSYERSIAKIAATFGDLLGGAMSRVAPVVSGVPSSVGGNASIVKSIFSSMFGWARYWPQTYSLLMKESGFRNTAQNPTSTAFGMFQFLDSTWGGYGVPKTSDPRLQTIAGGRYIRARYGNPANALAFHLRNNWYDDGGMWQPGTVGFNASGKPEAVFNDAQWKTLRAAVAPVLAAGGGRSRRMRIVGGQIAVELGRSEGYIRELIVEEMADEDGHQNRFGD